MGRWIAMLVLLAGFIAQAHAQVHVRGYHRKDGTYVAPHYRSAPNSTRSDNYSSRGNLNPYTGQRGTVDPYRSPPSTGLPAPQPVPAQRLPAPAVAVQQVAAWRCVDVTGAVWYLAYPRAGCDEVVIDARMPESAPNAVVLPSSGRFAGYPCTVDCSGHKAGYAWAARRGIDDPDNCGGNSPSFIEGCRVYAHELQAQMVEDQDCDDFDGDELCD